MQSEHFLSFNVALLQKKHRFSWLKTKDVVILRFKG